MPAIGYVTQDENGSYTGHLKTLSIRADSTIVANAKRSRDTQPHYRALSRDVEIGAGWNRHSETSGRDYVSLRLAAQECGQRRISSNPGRAGACAGMRRMAERIVGTAWIMRVRYSVG